MPTSFDLGIGLTGNFVLSVWIQNSAGATSTRVDTGSVTYRLPKLATKNLSGSPGATATLSFSGVSHTDLQLRFRNKETNAIDGTSTVSAGGGVTLPTKAGLYRLELKDTVASSPGYSYGDATVTNTVASWSYQNTTSLSGFAIYQNWPLTDFAVGDYSGDGNLDIVVPEGQTATGDSVSPGIRLYKYTAGSYPLDQTLATSYDHIFGLKLVDLTNHGALDIVFARMNLAGFGYQLCTMKNNGTSGFASPSCVAEYGNSTSIDYLDAIAVTDLNQDGYPDVVVVGGVFTGSGTTWTSKVIWIWKGSATGLSLSQTVALPAAPDPYGDVRIGDMNDDGKLDIFASDFTNPSGNLSVFPQAADGTFSSSTAIVVSAPSVSSFDVGYLSGSARLDVVAGGTSAFSSYYFAASGNSFSNSVISSPPEQTTGAVLIADVAKTGTPYIYFGPRNRLLFDDESGFFFYTVADLPTPLLTSATNTIVGGNALETWQDGAPKFADLNDDGKLDVVNVSAYNGFFEWLKAQ